MGFSLSRALAGAVVGGAHAAGQVFDAQLAEAAKDRARQEDELRAQRQAVFADELLAQREESKRSYNEAQEKGKRDKFSTIIKDQRSIMDEKGIKVGSAEGQMMIGQAFMDAGHPEQGNIFFDNMQKIQQADNANEIKKLQIAATAETSRLARASRGDQLTDRQERRAEASEQKLFAYANTMGQNMQYFDPETNKFQPYRAGANYAAKIVSEGVAAKKDPDEIREAINNFVVQGDAMLRSPKYKGQDPSTVLSAGASDYLSAWLSPKQTTAPVTPVPQPTATPATPQQTKRIPGVTESAPASKNGQLGSGLMNKIPY